MKNGQTSVLFKYFVKNQLKKQDLRYSDLAEHLNLSLAAVKKIMTEGDFKLSRMESIASWLGFTLLEALQINDKGPAETKETHLDLFRKVLEFNRWQRRRTTLVSSEFSINRS
jgi:ribosome-binding protein aMBF1 (putative translation factor)